MTKTASLESFCEKLLPLMTYDTGSSTNIVDRLEWSCQVVASLLTKSPIPELPESLQTISKFVEKKKEIAKDFNHFNKFRACPPTLCGWHYRHNSLNDGRLSIITSSPICDPAVGELKFDHDFSALEYHKNLLQVYFSIFGRINTFNEKIFELFLNTDSKSSPALYAVKFACDDIEAGKQRIRIQKRELSIQDSSPVTVRIIEISCPLEDSLVGKGSGDLRRELLCDPGVDIKGIVGGDNIRLWLRCLKRGEWLSEREKALISTCFRIIHEDEVNVWQPFFEFMNFNTASESSEDNWSPQTTLKLIESLNFLQGVLLYKPFASKWLGTYIPVPSQDHHTLSAITLGFDKVPYDLDDFKMILRDASIALGMVSKQAFVMLSPVSEIEGMTIKERIGAGLYESIKSKLNESFSGEMEESLHYLLSIGDGMRNAIHEGRQLSFLLYFGKATTLSHFHEIYTFKREEQRSTNIASEPGRKRFANLLKSHYSHLQHIARGIFVDMDHEASYRIVEPIMSDLYQEIFASPYSKLKVTGFENRHDLCCLVTSKIPNLGAVVFGEGRIAIYLGGKRVLAWPDHDELKWWSPILIDSWNSEETLVALLNKCNNLSNVEFREQDIKLLAECCLQISASPRCGAIFLITKHLETDIDRMRVSMNPYKLNWVNTTHIQDLNKDDLFDMAVQDGGTLIPIDTGIVENQQHFVPIKEGKAYNYQDKIDGYVDENRATYGVRHATACDMSAVLYEKCVVITISEDGPISVFYRGRRIAPSDIASIGLE